MAILAQSVSDVLAVNSADFPMSLLPLAAFLVVMILAWLDHDPHPPDIGHRRRR